MTELDGRSGTADELGRPALDSYGHFPSPEAIAADRFPIPSPPSKGPERHADQYRDRVLHRRRASV